MRLQPAIIARVTQKNRLLQRFEEKQAQWTALDEIAQLRCSKHTLWYLLAFGPGQSYGSGSSQELQGNLHACYSRSRIDKLLQLDVMGIVARVLSILYDFQRKGFFLNQRGREAQASLDLLQAVSPYFPHVTSIEAKFSST